MEKHFLAVDGKSIPFTDKSVFRVEESRNSKCAYESVFSHKDPVKAIRYFKATVESSRNVGFRVRLVKDGDSFEIIFKKTF